MNDSTTIRINAFALACAALVVAGSPGRAADGAWMNLLDGDASGSWPAPANWSGGTVADGANNTANFATLDITNLSTVTLDGARTIGGLIFGDVNPDANWVLATGSGGPLTLDAAAPAIVVSNQVATLSAVLAGSNGFTKTGAGTLVLNNTGNVGLSNHIVVDGGVLVAAANTGVIGAASDGYAAGTNNILIVHDGATFQLNPNVQINNKQLRIVGAGAGGVGAFDVNAAGTGNGTRWGIGGATALVPFLALDGDATMRVAGAAAGNNNDRLLLHSLDIGTNTLTKTGGGRLDFDQQNRTSGDGLVHIIEGALGFRSGGFTGGRSLSVDAGAEARVNGDNNALNSTANTVTINGQIDLNARGNGSPGSDTTSFSQRVGLLAGSGLVTSGTFGNAGTQTLTVEHDATSNSVFAGTITQANGRVNLVKAGDNTLTLSGTNGVAGTTTINAGALLINGVHTGAGGYLVNAGGTLGGAGIIMAPVTNAGTLWAGDPGTPGSTLTVVSNVLGTFIDTVVISNANLVVDEYLGELSMGQIGTLIMTNGTLDMPLRTTSSSAFVTTLTVEGNAVIRFRMDAPLIGQFPIISYISLGGTAGFGGLSLVSPPGITANLVDTGTSIDVNITAIPALTWEGLPGGVWDIGGGNWKSGATYTETAGSGPFVVFDDTAGGTTTVSLGSTLSPQGVSVNNSGLSYSFTGAGKLSGAGGIAKQGTGTLTVANSGGNDFTGAVNINAGTVQVGNGGTTGDLGTGPVANLGVLALNRSDTFALANTVSGNGSLTKAGAGSATVPFIGDSSGMVSVNAGALLLGPVGTSKISGDVTGSGVFGVNGSGSVVLSGFNNTYSGGTVISNGTLQFGDEFGSGVLPPAGNIPNNGTLATTLFGTLANNISGTGGLAILSNAMVTLSGANTYSGPTRILGQGVASLTANAGNYPAGSVLVLGSTNGGPDIGSATFPSGNPVLGGLVAGGNSASPGNPLYLTGSGQTLTVNGNLMVGNVGPAGASVLLPITGAGAAVSVATNGGVIQIGLGASGSGVNPDNVFLDLSQIDVFSANLGTSGVVNLGTLDGNPGPSSGATVVNWFKLASVSNHVTAGAVNVGAGGRQLVPELFLGAGTNLFNVDSFICGFGGRDGSYVHFEGPTGGFKLRGNDGLSRALFAIGNNPATGTGASITNTVDFTGHPVDLLVGTLIIGNYNNAGVYQNSLAMDAGTLDAQSTSLSVLRNNNGNAAASGSTLSIGGGTARLGTVSLTASAAYGTLNISNAAVTVFELTSAGAGTATLNIDNATLTVDRGTAGNPPAAAMAVDNLLATGTVNLGLKGTNFIVGQFPLLSYSGAIGGSGYPAFALTALPDNVSAYLSNNVANTSVDVVITAAPPAEPVVDPTPTNITYTVSGSTLTLGWPESHTGWILQSQTNSLGVGLTSTWYDVAGSAGTNAVQFAVNPAAPTVFYRLRLP